MQINREYEREISIADVIFDVLYHWRPILIAALIGAVALAALQYHTIASAHREGKLLKEEMQYEIDLQDYQDSLRNVENSIKTYTNLLEEQNEYLRESIYINLDSQNEWFANKTYFVKIDPSELAALPENSKEDPSDYVIDAYASFIKGGLDSAEMKEVMGTDNKAYIDELVMVATNTVSNTVLLQIVGKDQESVEKQIAYFDNRMQGVARESAQAVGKHALAVVSQDMGTRLDRDLASRKDEVNRNITEWQTMLKDQRQTKLELIDQKEPKQPGNRILRFAVIGFILGAALVMGIRALKYVLGDQIHSESDMQKALGIPVFGKLAKFRARRSGKGIDKLFEKWEFRKANTDAGVVYDNISALLREQYAGSRVLLLGTVPETSVKAVRDNLQKRLSGVCEIAARGGMPDNPDAIMDARQADAVILVEEKYASRMRDVIRAAELLQIDGANVKGCVII